jgi:hypothetical protein
MQEDPKAFMSKATKILVFYILSFLAVDAVAIILLRPKLTTSPWLFLGVITGITVVYLGGLCFLIIWFIRRTRQFQAHFESEPPPEIEHTNNLKVQPSRAAIYGSLAGGVFGATCWMIFPSMLSGDWIVLGIISISAVLIWLVSAKIAMKNPNRLFGLIAWVLAALAAVNLIVVNLRWETWMSYYRQSKFYDPVNDVSVWQVNKLVGGLFGLLFVIFLIVHLAQRKTSGTGR